MHFRNVRVTTPREKYTEVFLDEGEVDVFGVMKELVRSKYPRLIYPGIRVVSMRTASKQVRDGTRGLGL
jgi:D-mannonate dehydratase